MRRLAVAALVLVVLGGYAAVRGALAADAGGEGRLALARAEAHLGDRDLDAARRDLDEAGEAFADAEGHIAGLGPLAWVARATPLVRVQMRAVDSYTDAGTLLVTAGRRLVDAAEGVLEPADGDVAVAGALAALQDTHRAVVDGRVSLEEAAAKVEALDGLRLLGPLGTVRDAFLEQVPEVRERARSADEGLAALIAFAGGDGARRYLLLSQNPDEPRPTGGFIGSYGVLAATGEGIDLERYEGIESWQPPLPPPSVPVDEAPTAFSVPFEPQAQTMRNVNATAHFPDAAELATSMWAEAGEEPVDGVVAFTPELLARLLAVLGPVQVPGYDDTIGAANVIERLDFHTHRPEVIGEPDRKQLLAALSEVVVDALLAAPATSWEPLLSAVGDAFDAREAVAWSTDEAVTTALDARDWQGSLPEALGDFVHLAEFAYTTKAGRGLERHFDHRVALQPDGSARTTTTVTIANTLPFSDTGKLNLDSLSYLTLFGPEGATFSDDRSDRIYAFEEPVAGHPGVGIVAAAEPLGETSFTLGWDAPRVALERVDGRFEYRLTWLHLPGRTDTMSLQVALPPGWSWVGEAPPAEVTLGAEDFSGAWILRGP